MEKSAADDRMEGDASRNRTSVGSNSSIPASDEHFLLKDLDTGMKSYVTDQEWVEKPVVPSPLLPAYPQPPQPSQHQQQTQASLPPLPPSNKQDIAADQQYPQPTMGGHHHHLNHHIRHHRQSDHSSEQSTSTLATATQKRTRPNIPQQPHNYSNLNSNSNGDSVVFEVPKANYNGLRPFLRPVDHVRVLSHRKKERDFANLYRWQRIHAHNGAIRAMEFNPTGEWLATGGVDTYVKIWEIDYNINVKDEDYDSKTEAKKNVNNNSVHMYLKKGIAHLTCQGHTSDITSLSWSKNNFLLSGSLDYTIRLWHPLKQSCLRTIVHNDMVTSLSFHPTDEQICITGTSNGFVNLWQLKEKETLSQTKVDELITCLAITPDGKNVLIGTLYGRCYFYGLFDEIQGEWQFKHTTQLDVRSSRLKRSKKNSKKSGSQLKNGKKICGFQFYNSSNRNNLLNSLSSSSSPIYKNDEKVLVTSNDSRLRLFRLDDKSIIYKFIGCVNESSRLSGCFDPNRRFVLCASEERKIYIWDLQQRHSKSQQQNQQLEQHGIDNILNNPSEIDMDSDYDSDEDFDSTSHSQSYTTDAGSSSFASSAGNSNAHTNNQHQQAHGQHKRDIGVAHESFVVQDSGHLTVAQFAPRVISKDVMNSRQAFSNPKTSGLTIVTASDDGDIRVFGCC